MINPFLEVVVPYAAFAIFVIGVLYRIVTWASSAVPLKIPTTSGQHGTLPFIRRTIHDRIDSPYNKWEVVLRMLTEIFLFRSLWRNTKYYVYGHEHKDRRWLWGFAMLFHWSFLIILIRHLRFFMEPVPEPFIFLTEMIAIKAWVPAIYVTGLTALIGLGYLLLRRIFLGNERTISLPSDYLAPILLLSIIISGLLMRYIYKIPLAPVKELALGLITFQIDFANPPDVHWLFLVHLTLVCITIAYFPFSKLMHAGGILFSPTRNMPNDNRRRRHVNPWNPPYVGITFEEHYENYRDQMEEIAERGYNFRPEVE
ncbi:MAG TPA: menaquinol oxidoreductase [Archaeoglobaceae archaeon]|nr:menaquinol oxidoreductase [Archaeoglobaceae archaeon]